MKTRRAWFRDALCGAIAAGNLPRFTRAGDGPRRAGLRITGLKITPVALPDPPLLAASGCHGPYFLRNIVEVTTDSGIVGVGETVGGERVTLALQRAARVVTGRDAFGYRGLTRELMSLNPGCYAGVELACLDACGKAAGLRICELLGGPVRESVEFSAYLFYRYAADHPVILSDPRRATPHAAGAPPLDDWGEVRTPEAMAHLAAAFQRKWGFRVFKLKGGVLAPDVELDTLSALGSKLGPAAKLRIDPNARWTSATSLRIGRAIKSRRINLEYYEDPVGGQTSMAEIRRETGLPTATNMCVTRFEHFAEALRVHPIDVLLSDHHYFGGLTGCQALGPIADAAGWTVGQHSNSHAGLTMAAMIHLAASLPQLTPASDTHYPWLPDADDLIDGPRLSIRDGVMAVPTGPGLGVGLDRDKLARAHEIYEKSSMRGRDDASLMRRLEPGWTSSPL